MLARFLYKSYAGFYRLRHWRKQHLTTAGELMLAAFFLSVVFGMNISKTNLYQVTALTGCFAIAAFVCSLFPFKCKISVTRHLPVHVTAGDEVIYELQITNLSSVKQKGLILFENVFDPRPSFNAFLKKKEPLEHLRNAWDKKTLYYRWLWLIYKNKNTYLYPVKLPDLPVGKSIRVPVTVTPHFRGYVHFSGVSIARPDLLGLFLRLFHINHPGKLLVLPKVRRVELPDLASTRQYHPGGIQLASSIGNSDEFMGLRQYRPGDSLRNIHWKSFAKTNELVIKEFEDEFFQRHALILETDVSIDEAVYFEEAVSIASYCITSMQSRDSVLDLMFAGSEVYSFSSGRGLGQIKKMHEILACVEPSEEKTILDVIPVLKEHIRQFSGVICILASWKSGYRKLVDVFNDSGLPFYMIVIADDKTRRMKQILKDVPSMEGIHVVKIVQHKKDQTQ